MTFLQAMEVMSLLALGRAVEAEVLARKCLGEATGLQGVAWMEWPLMVWCFGVM